MIYTTYDPASGTIKGQAMMPPEQLSQINQLFIAGAWDGALYYVKDGQAVPYPAKPDGAGWVVWSWQLPTQTWTVNAQATSIAARKIRRDRLAVVDRVNPVWYASLSAERQIELQQYRQALLDVPQQSGFPVDINWPSKPLWL